MSAGRRPPSAQSPGAPAHPLVRLAGWVRLGLWHHLNPTERAVFTVYASFANKKGTAWPAVKTIGLLTGHSRRSIFQGLQIGRAHV